MSGLPDPHLPRTRAVTVDAKDYDRAQRHNPLVRFLHSVRYRHILEVVTDLAAELSPAPVRILELGAAHGKLYATLAGAVPVDYTGIELREDFVAVARRRFGDRPGFRMVLGSAADPAVLTAHGRPDIIVALETFEHMWGRDVVRAVETIAGMRPRLLVASVPVEIGPAVLLKNVGSAVAGYRRHREYTWPETWRAGLYQLDRIPPHRRGHKGFDWRWLAQTIRQNMTIREIRRFPFRFLPAALSTSVFMVAEPWEAPPG